MEPLHEVTDQAKVNALAKAIERDGWQGAPLVADGDQLLTGVHRYAALRQLEWGMAQIDEVTIDIRDIFAEADLDFEAEVDAVISQYSDPIVAVIDTLRLLSHDVRERYGIDCE